MDVGVWSVGRWSPAFARPFLMRTRGSWTGLQWPARERPGQPPCRVPGGMPQWRCQWPARQLERQGTVAAASEGSGPPPGLLPGPGGARNHPRSDGGGGPGGPCCTRPATLLTGRAVAAASGGPRRPSGLPDSAPVPGMLRGRGAGFRPAAVAAGGAVPKSALSAVATYAPPRRAHHHKPAGGIPKPECRARPPAVHVEGGESSGPGPALATTVPGVCLLSRLPRRTCVPHPSRRPHAAGQPAVPSAGGRYPEIYCRRQVCARCHRKKKDLQPIALTARSCPCMA
jgi:hypothetical protein